MSTPTVPLTDPRTDDVLAYIGAVRAWLADLPADDVEELTSGMEADLAERAAEGDLRLGELLGEPEDYAAELRSAAGLPPRVVAAEASPAAGWWARSVAELRAEVDRRVEDWPWLRDLRPVWWLARGWALGWGLAVLLGTGRVVLLPLLGAALSFWLGRRPARAGRSQGLAAVVLGTNLLAAALLLPLAGSVVDGVSVSDGGYGDSASYAPSGLSLDGGPVENLYVYDAEGRRVDGARILDQTGQRVYVDPGSLASTLPDAPTRPDGSVDVASDVFPLVVGDRDPWTDPGQGWVPPQTLAPVPVVPEPSASSAPSSGTSGTPGTPGTSGEGSAPSSGSSGRPRREADLRGGALR